MRAVLVAPVNQRHRLRPIPELLRPIEGRVTATDDHDILTAELLRIRHPVENPLPVPRLRAGLRQSPRRERAYPRGYDDRAGRKAIGLGDQNEVIFVPLQGG